MILEDEGAGEKPFVLFKQFGGRCTIPCVSFCLEMAPCTAEVPRPNVTRALDLEHGDGPVWLMCAVSDFPPRPLCVPACWCSSLSSPFCEGMGRAGPCLDGERSLGRRWQTSVLEQRSRRQGSLSPSPATSVFGEYPGVMGLGLSWSLWCCVRHRTSLHLHLPAGETKGTRFLRCGLTALSPLAAQECFSITIFLRLLKDKTVPLGHRTLLPTLVSSMGCRDWCQPPSAPRLVPRKGLILQKRHLLSPLSPGKPRCCFPLSNVVLSPAVPSALLSPAEHGEGKSGSGHLIE